jgi:integrase/recombinase XerD
VGAQSTIAKKPDPVEKAFSSALLRLRVSPDVSDEDKASILGLVDHLLAKNIGKRRALKYINHLIVICRFAKVPLGSLNRKTIEPLIGKINAANYTEHTKHDCKVILKKYFQWLRGSSEDEQEYPEEVRWIKATLKKKHLLPEALLSIDEIKRLVEAAENLRDKALILVHYESGCRIGETLGLKILHVTSDEYGAVLRVNGKTGPRRVRIIASAPALSLWLSVHPFRNNSDAPLWVGVGTVGRNEALSYDGARALLRRLAKKIGLNKRIYSHLMRHSRATELASFLTEAQMKEFLGWVQGSDMPSTYVHLSGRNVDGALLKAHGIQLNEDKTIKIGLSIVKCPRCRKESGSEAKFCPFCGIALDIKASLGLDQSKEKADHIMDLLMADDEFRGFLSRKICQLFGSSQPGCKSLKSQQPKMGGG